MSEDELRAAIRSLRGAAMMCRSDRNLRSAMQLEAIAREREAELAALVSPTDPETPR